MIMRDATRCAALLVALLAFLPASVFPQGSATDFHEREGFWIAFGFGPSYQSIACDECVTTGSNDPWGAGGGGSLWLSLGGAMSPSVLLGGGFNATDIGVFAGGDESERSSALTALLFLVRYYPRPASGLHLKGGLGFGRVVLSDVDREVLSSDGFALQAGVGHDFRFGGRFGLTPFLDLGTVLSSAATVTYNDRLVGTQARPWYAQAGLGFGWY
jgi:hypothetical protein